jgi:hypothetical protein
MRQNITTGKGRLIAAALLTLLAIGAVAAQMAFVPALANEKDGSSTLDAKVRESIAAAARGPQGGGWPLLPWTAVASTGAVDEDSLADYAFGDPLATYRAGSPSVDPLTFRYNVTNPGHDTPIPGWTHLILSSQVGPNGGARATLYRVHRCTGERVEICRAINDEASDQPRCTACEFAPAAINFQEYLYYVSVQLDRQFPGGQPAVYSVQLQP